MRIEGIVRFLAEMGRIIITRDGRRDEQASRDDGDEPCGDCVGAVGAAHGGRLCPAAISQQGG
jgi:hypothetical protein